MTTALILFLIILLASLLMADFGWSNVLSGHRNEVVFADRNRAYGAYHMRQEHHRVMVLALSSGLGVASAVTVLPTVLSSGVKIGMKPPITTVVEFVNDPLVPQQPKPIEKATPPVASGPSTPSDPANVIPVDSIAPNEVDTATTSMTAAPGLVPRDTVATSALSAAPTAGSTAGTTDGASSGSTVVVMKPWQVDPLPEFPGGEPGLRDHYENNLQYPEQPQMLGLEGTVWVEFVVDVDGSVKQVRVAKGVSTELDAEAVRTVKRMPKWKPGLYQGSPVPVLFQQKIVFELDQ